VDACGASQRVMIARLGGTEEELGLCLFIIYRSNWTVN
jgi:hypothetical protein